MTDQSKPRTPAIDESALPDFSLATPKERCLETLLRNYMKFLEYVPRTIEHMEPYAVVVLIAAGDARGKVVAGMLVVQGVFVEDVCEAHGETFHFAVVRRPVIAEVLARFDTEVLGKLARIRGVDAPVIVIDHGVAEVFFANSTGLHIV